MSQPASIQPTNIQPTSVKRTSVQQTSIQSTWTTERVELLKLRFAEGLSCREIAADIGVSRNAVIGKISRLNLTRDKGRTQTLRQKDNAPRSRASARLRQLFIQVVPPELEPEPFIEAEPIHNGHTCSLFELSKETCRWPISTPGADDFCFCGNPPIEGLPYCAGHSRLAYRIAAVR